MYILPGLLGSFQKRTGSKGRLAEHNPLSFLEAPSRIPEGEATRRGHSLSLSHQKLATLHSHAARSFKLARVLARARVNFICAYTYTHIYTYVCIYIYVYANMYLCICICIYTVYRYTYTCKKIPASSSSASPLLTVLAPEPAPRDRSSGRRLPGYLKDSDSPSHGLAPR